jgi:uncharacterized Tic20 family protein
MVQVKYSKAKKKPFGDRGGGEKVEFSITASFHVFLLINVLIFYLFLEVVLLTFVFKDMTGFVNENYIFIWIFLPGSFIMGHTHTYTCTRQLLKTILYLPVKC